MALPKLFIIVFCVAANLLAFEPSTVTVTLVNKSSSTFELERIKVAFRGNQVEVDARTLPPGGTMVITGTIAMDYDLSADLYFRDGSRFALKDRRQFHTGQPVFYMDSKVVKSTIVSRTRNPITKPRQLSFVAADVLLGDRHHH